MKTLLCAPFAALALTVATSSHAHGAPLAKPCSVRLHAIAAVGPCFGSVGTTLTITIFAAHHARLTALRFEPPRVASVLPEPAVTPLLGRGRVLSANAPRELCNAGNNSRWQVWLVGPYGQRLERIGDFTVIGCLQSNAQ